MIPSVRSLPLIIAVAFVAVLGTNSSRAQKWRQIGKLPDSLDLRCAYFWDTAHGVVGGVNCIYTYTSGVWAAATYPEAPDTIKSLRLLDGVNLYAACGSTCVWESTDHGRTWQKTPTLLTKADDIYLGADGLIHGINLKGTGGMTLGTTFARRSALSCVIARDDQTALNFSTDGGLHWSPNAPPSVDAGYNVIADTCTGRFYTITDGVKGELWESKDGGITWTMIYDFDASAKDIIEGNGNTLYVQGVKQVFVHVDGLSWIGIGGPGSQLEDRRMFCFGPNNKYLVDMIQGAVWMFDGGTNFGFPDPVYAMAIDSVGCSPSYFLFDIAMPFADSLFVKASTHDGIVISPTNTEYTLQPGVTYERYTIQVPQGQPSGTIYVHDSLGYVSCSTQLAWNDSFSFNLLPQHVHAWMASTLAVPYCQDPLIPLMISTDICDTARVDSITIATGDGTFLYSGTLPAVVMPGDTDTLWITGKDLIQGTFSLQVKLQGTTRTGSGFFDTTLRLSGTVGGSGPTSKLFFSHASKIASCVAARFPLSFQTYYCDSIFIDSLIIEDTTGAYVIDHTIPTIIPNNSSDTIWISVAQNIPGTYSTNIHLYGRSALAGKIDTEFHIFYTVVPDPAVPRVETHNASRSNCKVSTVSLLLQSLPCDSVEFTYSNFTISGTGVQMTNDLTLPLTLQVASSDTVLITFPPQGLVGNYIVTAHLKGKYLGSPVTFDTTVSFTVSFSNQKSSLTPNLSYVALDSVGFCASTDTTVSFTNLGCDSIKIISDISIWNPGWSVSDPTFPFLLAPDSSFSLRIHFIPTWPGSPSQTVSYSFEYNGTSGNPPNLSLTSTVVPAQASLTLSNTAFDFGSMSRCALRSQDTTITISNTGCDSLLLSNASISGTGFTLTSARDTELAPDETVTYRVHFSDSVPNSYSGTFHVTGIGAHGGNRIDTTVNFKTIIVPGSYAASIDRSAIDFGTTSICEERDTTLTITNTGCESDTIYSANFSCTQFSLVPVVSFPIVLAPDSSVSFRIVTNLDTAGHPNSNAGTLQFSLSNGISFPSVLLSRGVIYPGAFTLGLTAEPTAPLNATVPISVQRTSGTIPIEANEVDFDLIYNEDLLGYTDPVQPDVKLLNKVLLTNGMTDRTFAMNPASDRDTLATFPFQTYLTKNTSTSISLVRPQFVVQGAISPECVASIDSNNVPSNFRLNLACGDSTILAAWSSSPPFSISGIVPNPASNTVAVLGANLGNASAEFFNILGTTPQPPPIPLRSVGGEVSFDVSPLASGTYYVRFSEAGYVQTRKIEISR